jgi:hypothetical protein
MRASPHTLAALDRYWLKADTQSLARRFGHAFECPGGWLAKGSRGKSGGFRTIVAHRQGDRLVCLYMFSKNQRDNITEQERLALSEIGDEYMGLTVAQIDDLVAKGVLTEVMCDGDEEGERNPR